MTKDKLQLSEKEKEMLRRLKSEEFNYDNFSDYTQAEINTAASYLKRAGLIATVCSTSKGLTFAELTDQGTVYLSENPLLSDPISKDIEILTKKNLELENNELEHKKRIRSQENIIRLWQLFTAVFGIIGLVGWLLLLL